MSWKSNCGFSFSGTYFIENQKRKNGRKEGFQLRSQKLSGAFLAERRIDALIHTKIKKTLVSFANALPLREEPRTWAGSLLPFIRINNNSKHQEGLALYCPATSPPTRESQDKWDVWHHYQDLVDENIREERKQDCFGGFGWWYTEKWNIITRKWNRHIQGEVTSIYYIQFRESLRISYIADSQRKCKGIEGG